MRIFVGMGSSNDIPKLYFDECSLFLNKLLKDNDLTFGGYDSGLMGLAYHACKNNSNKVLGAASVDYKNDLLKLDCDKKIVVDNLLERTHELLINCDAIVFLPGGIETIIELFSSLAYSRNNTINIPIVFYNLNHYYDKLLEFMEVMYNENFARNEVKDYYFIY